MRRTGLILISVIIIHAVNIFASGTQEETIPAIRIWDFKYNDHRTNLVYKRIDKIFTDQNPEIIFEHIGFEDEEYVPALRAALLAGTAPDIIWLHQGPEFVEYQSYLEPMDDFLVESKLKFRAGALSVCVNNDGELKTLPVSFQGMGWYYNKDLFRQAGLNPEDPPQNWEDFLEACRILKEHGIIPIASGNNRPLSTDFIKRSLISAFYSEEEIKNFYKQGRGIASSEYRIIMDFCLTLRTEGYLNPEGIFRPYFNYAPNSFSTGRCAMIVGLTSDIAHWKEFSDKLGKDNLGYFPNLIHPSMEKPGSQLLQNAGVIIGVNKKSENKELAFKYLEHLFSEESQKLLVKGLGMLVTIENLKLPVEDYPVLLSIESALQNTGPDIEQYTPSTFVHDITYRYDRLLLNTMEINLDEYIQSLYDKLKLF